MSKSTNIAISLIFAIIFCITVASAINLPSPKEFIKGFKGIKLNSDAAKRFSLDLNYDCAILSCNKPVGSECSEDCNPNGGDGTSTTWFE